MTVDCSYGSISGGLFVTNFDKTVIEKKLGIVLPSTAILSSNANFPLRIGSNANFYLINNLSLIKNESFRIIYRFIPTVVIIKKDAYCHHYLDWLWIELEKIFSINMMNNSFKLIGINTLRLNSVENFAYQLLSLSNQNSNELMIDNFIQNHKEFFIKALKYEDAKKVELKWIETDNSGLTNSKPDFLLINSEGYCDILDLKTGAPKHKSLTKFKKLQGNAKARIRFVDYVNELISQLKDYQRYFKKEKNRKWAYDTHGIKVDPDNLKLIGIVGNYNNFKKLEVEQALSVYSDNIIILSYSDLFNFLNLNESDTDDKVFCTIKKPLMTLPNLSSETIKKYHIDPLFRFMDKINSKSK